MVITDMDGYVVEAAPIIRWAMFPYRKDGERQDWHITEVVLRCSSECASIEWGERSFSGGLVDNPLFPLGDEV